MNKAKKWHIFIIVAAISLTLINIFPTIFYYAQPLHEPVDGKRAEKIAGQISQRVNSLETQACDWVSSYAKVLGLKPKSITLDQADSISVTFAKDEDASLFASRVSRAGHLLPFPPSQLLVENSEESNVVRLHRYIPVHMTKDLFHYVEKGSPEYQGLVQDRLSQIALTCAGSSDQARALIALMANPNQDELILHLAQNIQAITDMFDENSPFAKRLFSRFTQGDFPSRTTAVGFLQNGIDNLLDRTKLERLESKSSDLSRENLLFAASQTVKKHAKDFAAGSTPLKNPTVENGQIKIGAHHPLIQAISVDFTSGKMVFALHSDVPEAANTLVYDEMARIQRATGEEIKPNQRTFEIALEKLPNTQSFLALDVDQYANQRIASLASHLSAHWNPMHTDLHRDQFPIWDQKTYDALSAEDKQFGLLIQRPKENGMLSRGSVYVIAKGVSQILAKYEENPDSSAAQTFFQDFTALRDRLQMEGFTGYPGQGPYQNDFIFEARDFCAPILMATREEFRLLGNQRYALLEFTDLEQRILTENRIDTDAHNDLLKWKDDYQTAQVSLDMQKRFDVAKPTKNTLLSNVALSLKKYFRGDERKVLRWGLDLMGGKTVRISLHDQDGQLVTNEAQIDQGINELYTRVNKMGVSEVNIRREGSHILLDFPGSQNYSASDLIKASSMYFHIVNEDFGGNDGQRFLQGVWNEALIKDKTDVDSVNAIAYRHLHETDLGKTLAHQGLRLTQDSKTTSAFDDQVSKIAILRDQTSGSHPLMIVFQNYALEGSNLANVHAGYDPTKGNYLSFAVKNRDAKTAFGTWTSTFCKDSVQGSLRSAATGGRGWRMAVILNGSIVSAPTLQAAITDGGVIEGSFTQREINGLEADLKAGSLSFSPKILSEENVSPELGEKDRSKGITATCIALAAVILMMIGYYRFAGIIASCAVIFNLLMMWATLQNIHATLTLAGIAGMILTLGMAVDANVLVFERVREEFAVSGNIQSALKSGYKKAFSAIFDSNLTTLIAALVLLNFDSGPIKAFAVMLIIGIVSSMFSAVFLTRTYFMRWARKTNKPKLNMASLINAKDFPFLRYSKHVIGVSLILAFVGGWTFYKQRSSIFGMDFTGGYALNLQLESGDRDAVAEALEKHGLSPQDFSIRELGSKTALRICLSSSLENQGQVFYDLPFATNEANVSFNYQNNPRLAWVISALDESGLQVAPQSLKTLDLNWSAMSGQISDAMRTNALAGIGLALIAILIYVTLRFEFKYAMSATLCLVHDVIISLAAIAIFHAMGLPIQIDLTTVAALMTIVGYSLNDTIIVFDRIREDAGIHKGKRKFTQLVNQALNITLSRTLMTSATTLIVLVALVLFGGGSILGFALVMAVGVVVGTFSSLFIAATLMLLFHKRETLTLVEA